MQEKLAPFQKAVEACIEGNDFEGAKVAIAAKKIEETKIETIQTVIKQLEAEVEEENQKDVSLRQQNGGIDAPGETPNVAPEKAAAKK